MIYDIIRMIRLLFLGILLLAGAGYYYLILPGKEYQESVCERTLGEGWKTLMTQGSSYGALCSNGRGTKRLPPLQLSQR